MQPHLIRQLVMEMGFDETLAAAILCRCPGLKAHQAVEWFYSHPSVLKRGARVRWPCLAHVDTLLAEGFPEEYILDAFEHTMDTRSPDTARQWLQEIFGNAVTKIFEEVVEQVQVAATDLAEDHADVDDDPWLHRNELMMEEVAKEVNFKFFPTSAASTDVSLRRLFLIQYEITGSESTVGELDVVTLWRLPLRQRWQFYMSWVGRLKESLLEELRDVVDEYRDAMRRLAEMRDMRDLHVMRSAKVLGMTTTAAARHLAKLNDIGPRIVIVEEAAEILEPHIVSSLNARTEHVILIGDHHQLRPTVTDYHLGKKYNLEVSLFERLICNGVPFARLSEQHRMRPEISRCLMPQFYERLRDAESVHKLPDVVGVEKNLFFLNHSHLEERNDSDTKSYCNRFEVDFIVGLCCYLRQQGYEASAVTILCCYRDQLFAMKAAMQNTICDQVRVTILDNYQGEECDIILLSMVRGNAEGRVGFLKTKNRICVAMSRAKIGFYCVGNFDFLAGNSDLWMDIRVALRENDCIGTALPIKCVMHECEQEVSSMAEFKTKAPQGGCEQACDFRMDCGHTCEMPCHNDDLDHKDCKCGAPCAHSCPGIDSATGEPYLHKCLKKCHEDCGSCQIMVDRQLTCGHMVNLECGRQMIVCSMPCEKLLGCGHPCLLKCGQPCEANSCKSLVNKVMDCSHEITLPCSESLSSRKCTELVEKLWPICGHNVEAPCHTDERKVLCPQPCNQRLSDYLHKCSGTCGKCRRGRLHVQCVRKCERVLICGHKCTGECCITCKPCTRNCETSCSHNTCASMGGGKKRKKTCGQPCPPCNERCAWLCPHSRCTLSCYEPCNRQACFKPCRQKLACGTATKPHYCIGVCGEPCPRIKYAELDVETGKEELVERPACWQCMSDEQRAAIREPIFGTEDKKGALFVQLIDCGHLFEMTAIDKHARQLAESGECAEPRHLPIINCPKCDQPALQTQRFGKFLKQRFCDIQTVKMRMQGKVNSLEEQRSDLGKKLEKMLVDSQFLAVALKLASAVRKSLTRDLTVQRVSRWKNLVAFLMGIDTIVSTMTVYDAKSLSAESTPRLHGVFSEWLGFRHIDCAQAVHSELQSLLDWLSVDGLKASELQLAEFNAELQRLGFLVEVCGFMSQLAANSTDLVDAASQAMLHDCFGQLFGAESLTKKHGAIVVAKLELLRQTNPLGVQRQAVKVRERIQLISAVGLSRAHWFRCHRGHIYSIDDCIEGNRCPECNMLASKARKQVPPADRKPKKRSVSRPPHKPSK